MGYLNGGVIESSKVFNFEILEGDDPYRSGGLVGLLSGGSISSSYVEDSKIHAYEYAGGLVGESSGTSTIEDSYTLNTTVKGTGSVVRGGGLVGTKLEAFWETHLGRVYGTALIINSFVKNTGVSGSASAGGIVGEGVEYRNLFFLCGFQQSCFRGNGRRSCRILQDWGEYFL